MCFGTLPSSNRVVSPLDAGGVVLVHRSVWVLTKSHVLEEVAKVYHEEVAKVYHITYRLDGHLGCTMQHPR